MRFERPWKIWEALEFWEAWKEALEGGGLGLGGLEALKQCRLWEVLGGWGGPLIRGPVLAAWRTATVPVAVLRQNPARSVWLKDTMPPTIVATP